MGKDKKAKAPVTLGAGGLAGAIGAYSSSPATGPSLLSAVLGDSSLDGEAQVLLKKLGKRDTTTKLKGLAELQSTLQEKGSDGGGGEWPPPGDHAARVRPPGAQVGCRARLSRGRGRPGARGGTRVGVCAHTHVSRVPGRAPCIHMRWSFFTRFFRPDRPCYHRVRPHTPLYTASSRPHTCQLQHHLYHAAPCGV